MFVCQIEAVAIFSNDVMLELVSLASRCLQNNLPFL